MKKIAYLFMLLVLLGPVQAQVTSYTFDKSSDDDQTDNEIYPASEIIFEIRTLTNQLCRYSGSDISYSLMNSFEDNFNTIHRKELDNLNDGIHTYYIRCRDSDDINDPTDGLTVLKATFKTSAPIAAQISIPDSPLTSGKYEINLITTKIPSTTPQLSYSYDGVSYAPIVLNGDGKNYEGYLIISDTPDEKIGSFKFEARDLENRIGTEIFGTKIFLTDTLPPDPINTISAIGEFEEIRLEWHLDDDEEDLSQINIYRSKSPNVNPTDYFKKVDEDDDYYVDDDVERGQTYYYRIAPEDKAGNIASLSREVKATALRSSSSSTSDTSLAPEFLGRVDALLVEIELLESEIRNSESSINSVATEKIRKDIGVIDLLKSANSELLAIKKTVENLKSQDLTETLLESRLSSNRAKLNILRKKTPESLSLEEESSIDQEVAEEDIRISILERFPELSTSLVDKSVKQSKELAKESNFKITSDIKIFEIIYLDGARSLTSLIQHSITSEIPDEQNKYLLLKLPSQLDSSSLKLKEGGGAIDSEDLVSFKADTKEISYVTESELNPQIISSIKITPVSIAEESTKITGYFSSNLSAVSSFGATFLVVIIAGLLVYLFYMKKAPKKEGASKSEAFEFIEKARKVKNLYKEGKIEESQKLYKSLQKDYIGLTESEKKKIFKEVKHML